MKFLLALASIVLSVTALQVSAQDMGGNSSTGSSSTGASATGAHTGVHTDTSASNDQTGLRENDRNMDQRSQSRMSAQSQNSQLKGARPTWQAHSMMSQTYLQAANDFIDGLQKQTGNEKILNSPQMKEHAQLYGRESLENLQRAKRHLSELSTAMSREGQGASGKRDTRESLQAAQRDIDNAIRQDQRLLNRLSDASFLRDKNAVKDQISQVHDSIKDALSNQKSVTGAISSIGD